MTFCEAVVNDVPCQAEAAVLVAMVCSVNCRPDLGIGRAPLCQPHYEEVLDPSPPMVCVDCGEPTVFSEPVQLS